ncbi:hypothetical protein SADUNF_Sadunf13G0075200 [Salix dunnii]|uniref:Uncharacterized protein n=1 Tax=Salix dunnii TaxID=1413687 RepID=A0A835JIU5_9ROSI|nr:hypothetical protein SADUNF_Sadunf13G0075200 [Salix dunnii]
MHHNSRNPGSPLFPDARILDKYGTPSQIIPKLDGLYFHGYSYFDVQESSSQKRCISCCMNETIEHSKTFNTPPRNSMQTDIISLHYN